MRVRRLIGASALAAGVVLASASGAVAQEADDDVVDSPAVLPTVVTQAPQLQPQPPPPVVRGAVLARTGSDIGEYVILGGVLAAGGVVLVVGARQRRHAAV